MLETSLRICFFFLFYDLIYMGEGYGVFGNPISNSDNSSVLSGQERKRKKKKNGDEEDGV